MNDGNVLFNVLIVTYLLSTVVYAVTVFSKKPAAIWISRILLLVGFHCHMIVIGQRWMLAGRPPLSNMFETLIFFSWCIVLVYLIVELKYKIRVLGAGASLAALLSLAYATLVFPGTIEPLMPALQNNFWLTIHVTLCFLGYAALGISYLAALIILMRRNDWHRYAASYAAALSLVAVAGGLVTVHLQRAGSVSLSLNAVTFLAFLFGGLVAGAVLTPVVMLAMKLIRLDSQVMDESVFETILYRTIILGFLFLAAGIVTGSVWAHQAWGRYWGWDPKETWSLITWLIYGIYLHVRFGWRKSGVATVWFAILGFWAVVFTYFGVNFLLAGLHSYA